MPTEHCPECPDQRAMLHFTYRDLHCVVVASILVAANHQDLVPDVRRLGRLLAPDPAHCQGHVESVTPSGVASQAKLRKMVGDRLQELCMPSHKMDDRDVDLHGQSTGQGTDRLQTGCS